AVSFTMRRVIHSTWEAAAMTISDELPNELLAKPGWRLLFSHPAHFISFGFGSGLARKAPGMFGTLAAFPLYWLLAPLLSDEMFLLLLIFAFVLGVWVCDITGK